MQLTRIDLNTWLVRLASKTILIDPWLVDPLIFYGQPWLFKASHAVPPIYTPQTLPPLDLILLSQGLDDHCHEPTLSQLDRQVPVVGCPAAARVVQALEYRSVFALTPWQKHQMGELSIEAIPGPQIQGQTQNGYLLRDLENGTVLYYEPHLCDPHTQARIARQTTIDVLLIPVVGQDFPLLGEVIMGPAKALEMVFALKPRAIVPTSVGDIRAEGLLARVIRPVGSLEEFARGLGTAYADRFYCPAPGETLEFAGYST